MTKLDQIKIAILDKYENGEITLEQATETYDAALNKYGCYCESNEDLDSDDVDSDEDEEKPKKKKIGKKKIKSPEDESNEDLDSDDVDSDEDEEKPKKKKIGKKKIKSPEDESDDECEDGEECEESVDINALNSTKLKIYESCDNGIISEDMKKTLLDILTI